MTVNANSTPAEKARFVLNAQKGKVLITINPHVVSDLVGENDYLRAELERRILAERGSP